MKRIHNSNDNKYAVISFLIVILVFSVACSLFHSEKDESSFQQEIIGMLATGDVSEPVTTEAPVSAQEPVQQSGQPQDSEPVTVDSGQKGYSVSAENFSCKCQEVSGIVTRELRVTDDHLEIVEADGEVVPYEKIGENTYRRSWMGYYILIENGQETKVDREESVVVTLTEKGYTKSQFHGDEGSPCCIHTFTQED